MGDQQYLNNTILFYGNSPKFEEWLKTQVYNQEILSEGLLYAIATDKYQVVQYLLDNGANVHYNNEEPLFKCIESPSTTDNYIIISMLITAGANINARNGKALIDLINKYINNRSASTILYTVNGQGKIDIDKYDYYNSMANINLSTIRELLNVGYDVSINDNEALVLAAKNKLWGIVLSLVSAGADIHARNNYVSDLLEEYKLYPGNGYNYYVIMKAAESSKNSIRFRNKIIKISNNPVYTVVDNSNINITCNHMNNFEDNYPLGIISGSQIPKKRLVALAKISDLDKWTPGKNINTQCFNADWLYETWFRSQEEATNPANQEPVDRAAVLYIKKLVESNPELTEEEKTDYYQVKPKVNSPVKVKSPVKVNSPVKVKSPVKTATFNLENVYAYSEEYMDNWLATFGLKYDILAKKRYMTISKLMEHNLFDNLDASLVLSHMNNFLSLLEYYPNSAVTLRQHLN